MRRISKRFSDRLTGADKRKSAASKKLGEIEAYNTSSAYHKAKEMLEELYAAKAVDAPIQNHEERVESGRRGVSLLFLKAFMDFTEEKGGDFNAEMEQICRRDFSGKTSVCALTDCSGLSLVESCMYLMRKNPKEYKGLFGTATTFFSYSWTGTSLIDVFESLKQVTVAELPLGHTHSFFWIDMFCASQNLLAGKYKHLKDNRGKPWKEDTDNIFKGAIETTKEVVFYCSPLVDTWIAPPHPYLRSDKNEPPKNWERKGPRAITRAWCLFEVAESLQKENCKLYVALSPQDRKHLLKMLTESFDDIITVFADTDANQAQISKVDDRGFILGEINKLDNGLEEINDQVKSGLRRWLADTAKRLEKGLAGLELASVKNGRGRLLQQQGQFAEGEQCFREALAIRKKIHGDEHPDVATSLNNLASLLKSQVSLGPQMFQRRFLGSFLKYGPRFFSFLTRL
jgi:tetratricopeptide (TPR) repeat protein